MFLVRQLDELGIFQSASLHLSDNFTHFLLSSLTSAVCYNGIVNSYVNAFLTVDDAE